MIFWLACDDCGLFCVLVVVVVGLIYAFWCFVLVCLFCLRFDLALRLLVAFVVCWLFGDLVFVVLVLLIVFACCDVYLYWLFC